MTNQDRDAELALADCPFCCGKMQFRKALWPSDGCVDAIIHNSSSNCGLVEFSDGTIDESIIAKWNLRATRRDEPVAWITKSGLENWLKGDQPEQHVLLRSGNDLRAPLYAHPAESQGALAEKDLADWSRLPSDLYVTSVRSDGIVFDVQCCSAPMAIGPEVRYCRPPRAPLSSRRCGRRWIIAKVCWP